MRAAISRYSAFAGSITSHGMPALAADSSRCRTVWDLPEPVAPHTNTCLFSDSRETASSPAGIRFWSRTVPSATPPRPPAPGLVSGVTSKSGRSVNRMPGTSRAGGRASAASSRDDPAQGNSGAGSPSSPAVPACGPSGSPAGGALDRPYGAELAAGCIAMTSCSSP